MSQISQKSIIGITSITTPVGIDDLFTIHSGNTTECFRVDQSGNQNITGIVTATNFKTGTTNVHNVGVEVAGVNVLGADTPIGTGATIYDAGGALFTGVVTATSFVGSGANLTGIDATAIKDSGGNVKVQAQASGAVYTGIHTFNSGAEVGSNIKLGNAGVITATSFVGDGSDLTNLPAGLGTALSATATSPLNKMYYTNQVLGVPSSVTVDVPASASKAYTQYADIKVESSADLIIAEGDDLIPDVLGLADFGTFGGGASAGRIRVNSISNAANDGSPTVQKGLVVTGVCTATSFSGSGANLTNLPAQATIANNADNRIITGGSGVNLNGESTLTYSGDTLLSTNSNFVIKSIDTNASNAENYIQFNAGYITYDSDASNSTGYSGHYFQADGAEKLRINGSGQLIFDADTNTWINRPAADTLAVTTNGSERLRIDSSGRLLLGTTTEGYSGGDDLTISTSGDTGITIRSGTSNQGTIAFSDGTSGADEYRGYVQYLHNGNALLFGTDATERLRITSNGKLTLNYAATPPSEDVMICTAGQASPAGLTLSHLSGGNRYGARLQTISGTNKGLIISELFNSSYTDLAKVNSEFGLKADNTCKAWLCYRSEAGNEGIQDDFNVASVNDEGTGTFWVNLDRNIHRHGNGFYQSIVFGSYNASSYPFVASIGYAPSHGSYNPWWDVEDNGCRVQTQRSDTGAILDAKVFSLAMFGDTGDLSPT